MVQLAQFSIRIQVQHLHFQPASYCHKTLLIKAALIIEYARGNSCGQNQIVLLLWLVAFYKTKNVKSFERKQVTQSLEASLVLTRIKLSRRMLILSGFWCLRFLTDELLRTRCRAPESPLWAQGRARRCSSTTPSLQHFPWLEPGVRSRPNGQELLYKQFQACRVRHVLRELYALVS